MRHGSLFLVLIFTTLSALAQEKPFYREYFLNRLLINPAVAGSHGCGIAHLTDHHQWFGIENAPNSQTFSFDNSFESKGFSKHGYGAVLYKDSNGPHKKLGGQLTYSHHILLNKISGSRLSFGISAAVYQFTFDGTLLNTQTPDPLLSGATEKIFGYNANAGIYYYDQHAFGGISAANLVPESLAVRDPNLQTDSKMLITALAGYKFGDEERATAFEPSAAFFLKDNQEKIINANMRIITKRLWLGVSYQHNLDATEELKASVIPALGITFDQLFIAYAHEVGIGPYQGNHYGSPFLKLGYTFCKEQSHHSAIKCPAYW